MVERIIRAARNGEKYKMIIVSVHVRVVCETSTDFVLSRLDDPRRARICR